MEGVTGETNGSLVPSKAGKETVNGQPTKEVIFADLIWVKLHEASWWPAQVVDENSVSSANKPSTSSKGSSSDVLVRLYGSYVYKYVDINRSRAEFKNILVENNFNHDDILKKSLEQDLASLNSSRSRRRQQSKSKGTVLTEASQNRSSEKDKSQIKVSSKKRKQEKSKTAVETKNKIPSPDRVHNISEPSTPSIISLKAQEMSGRRMKVMQSLGLVAPSGSPFPRNRVISPNPT
ncbi:uncharacterized protein LOC112509757 [Cynara cardunculus var. scolymus]|uniref:PWWP-like protein n=1 Tax=Cynara cardunculus var. scolymus TaxID=59895 RepID=A0A103YCV4_CYNCS|nr:uncharacterized protein LOC112509757 [Cynara cardunculus var. scolymus]KVI06757.1 PWWP-like protein [Cynara cardunculus var. scolymus]